VLRYDGRRRYCPGSLAGTPVFLDCSDVDFHIPKERVLHSAEVLGELGAEVTARLYPNMGHTINQDEIDAVTDFMVSIPRRRGAQVACQGEFTEPRKPYAIILQQL
jgi:hypothetical protein